MLEVRVEKTNTLNPWATELSAQVLKGNKSTRVFAHYRIELPAALSAI
jgi:hypothetical protein